MVDDKVEVVVEFVVVMEEVVLLVNEDRRVLIVMDVVDGDETDIVVVGDVGGVVNVGVGSD